MLLLLYFIIFNSQDIYNRNLLDLFELGQRLMIQRGHCDCHPANTDALQRIKDLMKNI